MGIDRPSGGHDRPGDDDDRTPARDNPAPRDDGQQPGERPDDGNADRPGEGDRETGDAGDAGKDREDKADRRGESDAAPEDSARNPGPENDATDRTETADDPDADELRRLADEEEARYDRMEAAGELPGQQAGEDQDVPPDQEAATAEPGEAASADSTSGQDDPGDGESAGNLDRDEEAPAYDLDADLGGDTPREALDRFEPAKANLPDISRDEAAAYVADNASQRPWLGPAETAGEGTQRVFASLDQGQGHGLERHEGSVTDDMHEDRVRYLRDPAHTGEVRYDKGAGMDGFKSGIHTCGTDSAGITDPDAYATAFAKGVEHPRVREVLDRPYDPDDRPDRVQVPVADLLGPDGHRYCTGYRLPENGPGGGDARAERKDWVKAVRDPDVPVPGVPEPRAEPIGSFEGGVIEFRFRRTPGGDRYEVATMFPLPRVDERSRGA